jgi:hypothetical protein
MRKLSAVLVAVTLTLLGCATVAREPAPAKAPQPAAENLAPAETQKPEAPKAETPKAEAEKPQPRERTVIESTFLLSRETTVYPDGSVSETSTFTYDADSPLLLKKETVDSHKALLETTTWEYTEGRLVRMTVKDGGGKLKSRRESAYTADGLLESDTLYGKDGKIASVSRYEYGPRGERTRWSVLDGSQAFLGSTLYMYQDGRNVRLDFLNAQGKPERSVLIEWDGDHRARETYRLPSGETEKHTEYAWKDGRLASETGFNASGQPVSRIEYVQAANGTVQSVLTFDRTGTLTMTRNREYQERKISRVVQE